MLFLVSDMLWPWPGRWVSLQGQEEKERRKRPLTLDPPCEKCSVT